MRLHIVAIISILSSKCFAEFDGSPVTCSSEGVECDHHVESNLIESVMHVPNLMQCRQLCLDHDKCQYISYFDDNAVPISHFCQLFKTCETVAQCSNCMTESMECFESCGSNIVGDLDENVIMSIPNIDAELDCKEL